MQHHSGNSTPPYLLWPGCNCYATISALFWSIPKYLQSLKHTQTSFKSLRFNKAFEFSNVVNPDGTAPFKLDWFGGKNCSWISFNNHGACGRFNDKNCGEATITFIRFHGKVDRANTNIFIWTKTSSHDLRLSEWSGTRLAKSRWFCGCNISSTHREMDGIFVTFIDDQKKAINWIRGKKTKHHGLRILLLKVYM